MKVLAHNKIKMLEENQVSYGIHFEFMGKDFMAYVIENEEMTYIDRCYNLEDEDIDIPTYFGTGFSHDVYIMIYEAVKTF